MNVSKLSLLAFTAVMAASASAQFTETESNNNKTEANVINPAAAGFTIAGQANGTSTVSGNATSADYYRLQMFGAPLGIYRHRLTQTVAGSTFAAMSIRGLSQSSTTGINLTSDSSFQSASSLTNGNTPARTLQWYGFGKSEQLFVAATGGTAAAPIDYTFTHSVESVSATDVAGSFTEGSITITTIGQTAADTDFWVYDSNFNAIPTFGNDDEGPGGTTLQSRIIRNFTAGTYYLAISNFNTANNQPGAVADEDSFSTLLDFPDLIANSNTATNVNISFRITDAFGSDIITQATKVNGFDVNFYKFTVAPVPEPGTIAALGLGALALMRRRKKA